MATCPICGTANSTCGSAPLQKPVFDLEQPREAPKTQPKPDPKGDAPVVDVQGDD